VQEVEELDFIKSLGYKLKIGQQVTKEDVLDNNVIFEYLPNFPV